MSRQNQQDSNNCLALSVYHSDLLEDIRTHTRHCPRDPPRLLSYEPNLSKLAVVDEGLKSRDEIPHNARHHLKNGAISYGENLQPKNTEIYPMSPGLGFGFVFNLTANLDTRINKGNTDLLVQWESLVKEDATWESLDDFCQRFPSIKLDLQDEGDDAFIGQQYYRKKAQISHISDALDLSSLIYSLYFFFISISII
nr:retrotransposon protein, putative, unclassified, expressed [Ipomoea batatas]